MRSESGRNFRLCEVFCVFAVFSVFFFFCTFGDQAGKTGILPLFFIFSMSWMFFGFYPGNLGRSRFLVEDLLNFRDPSSSPYIFGFQKCMGKKEKNRKWPEISAGSVGEGLPERTSLNFQDPSSPQYIQKCMGKTGVTGNPGYPHSSLTGPP